jgi:hypothetical protein
MNYLTFNRFDEFHRFNQSTDGGNHNVSIRNPYWNPNGGWGKRGNIVVFVSKIDPIFPSRLLYRKIVSSNSGVIPVSGGVLFVGKINLISLEMKKKMSFTHFSLKKGGML